MPDGPSGTERGERSSGGCVAWLSCSVPNAADGYSCSSELCRSFVEMTSGAASHLPGRDGSHHTEWVLPVSVLSGELLFCAYHVRAPCWADEPSPSQAGALLGGLSRASDLALRLQEDFLEGVVLVV